MNLTIHVRGSSNNRNAVHFSLTRNGFPEDVLTRQELRSLAITLLAEMPLLAHVPPGNGFSVDIGDQEQMVVPSVCPVPE